MPNVTDHQPKDLCPTIDKSLCSTVIEDSSVQAAMQPWIKMECYQLGRGNRIGRIDTLNLGDQQLVRERQDVAVQKLGATPSGLCTVSCCTPDPKFRFSEVGAGKTEAVFFMPENTEFDIYVPAGAQTTYVSFDQQEFLEGARALNPMDWECTPQQLITIHTQREQVELETAVSLCLKVAGATPTRDALPDTSVMRGMVLQNILRIVTATRQDNPMPSSFERSRAFHICRAALTFVQDCLADDVLPTIVDICKRVGASERTLQYAFLAYVDRSPQAYLRLCRLNRVRAALRASDPHNTTVTEVATRFGFFHLGRFAHDYRQVFGEIPSATLASW